MTWLELEELASPGSREMTQADREIFDEIVVSVAEPPPSPPGGDDRPPFPNPGASD